MKGKSGRKKGNFKEKLQDKSKEKPSHSSTEKNPVEKSQRCLGKLHLKKKCPARFSKCSKIGHWAQDCKSSKRGKAFEVAEEEESFFPGEIVDVCEVQSNLDCNRSCGHETSQLQA